MNRLVRASAVIAATGLLMTLSATAAEAGGPSTLVKLKISKNIDGPFKDHARVNIPPGEARNAYLKAKSISGSPEGAFLVDEYVPNNLVQRYFTKNGTEITDDVTVAPGYIFSAKPDKAKLFRLKLKRTGGPAQTCWAIFVQDDGEGKYAQAVIDVNIPNAECT